MSKRKKNKKRKGFTLLELVAVIIILGIIATIAIGRITTKMDEVRQSAYKTSVVNIIKAAENYAAQNLFKDPQPDYPIVFTCDSHECTNGSDRLSFKGDVPVSGTLSIDKDHRVTVSYLSNGKYCTSGVKTDLQVGKTCADIDITKPTLIAELDGKTINLTYNDNVGVTHYCVTTTDNPNTCNWTSITSTHELQEQGTYYVYVRDAKNNISNPIEIDAPTTAFCAYDIGQEWSFSYLTTYNGQSVSGAVEEWTVPCNGTYKLEVWGAQGGNAVGTGGKGGYATGEKTATVNDHWYVAVGGQGKTFNGGGASYNSNTGGGATGGGATHIGFENKQLKETAQSNLLIVAGGGGGASNFVGSGYNGGYGGGLTGGSGSLGTNSSVNQGGTQTAGGTNTSNWSYAGSYGQGGAYATSGGGGGGGFYGGSGSQNHSGNANGGAGGGSAYIGGVDNGSTIAGNAAMPKHDGTTGTMTGNTGNGYARITLIAY